MHYQYNPIKTLKTSVMGAINMLGLAKRTKAKILQASTSEVYGDPMVHPQVETYWGNVNPIGLRSCYDEGKRCAETLFMDYHRQNGVRIKIIRIFNTYGPRMNPNDGRVVSNFIVQALRGESITIYGDGTQTRSFQYVDDLIEAMIRMMATEDDFTGPVNTGNPDEFTMLELAERVIRLTGSKSEIVFNPLPSDDPKQRKPDISLGSAAGALPSNSNGACKRRSSISSRSSVIDSACDRDSFRPPLYTNGTCRKCDKVGGGSDFHPFFPNRSAIRSAYGSYKRSECGRVPNIGTRPHFSFHAVMPATGFKSKRHRNHRKRNTWANTADSVLRIVHGFCKDNPVCRAFSWQHAFARSEFGSSAPAARMNHSLQKKWLPQCLGEPPNRPS